MVLFFIFLTVFFSVMSLIINNVFFWWSIFLMMTIIFIFLNKGSKSYVSIFNYFIIQESLGLLFLIFSFGYLQFFILMMKIGVAPLHFWVFSVTSNIFNLNLMWFLTFQKLPFLFILLQMFLLSSFYIFVFGLFFCYLQMFVMKSYKNLMVISSTESFNWIVLGLFFSVYNSIYLFVYYFFLMLILINNFVKFNRNFINWETSLVFLNIPFSVSFFVKIFSLSELMKMDSFFILMILFTMFLSVLSFSYWLINLSMKSNFDKSDNMKSIYFFLFPMMLISII